MPTPFLGSTTAVDMDGLLTHTIQWIEKKGVIQDAVFAANQVFHHLKKNNRIRSSAPGGTHEQVNLLYGANDTFGSYRGYDVLPNDPQDGMTCAYYPWAQYSITVSIDGFSLLMNAGPAKIKDLIRSKMQQATMTIAEGLNEHLWVNTNTTADTGNGGKNIYSIPMLIDADADRDRAIAGINGGGADARTWWRNHEADYGATNTIPVFKRHLLDMYMTCASAGSMGGAPDLIIMDPDSYANYEMSVEPQRRYASGGRATAGFEDMYYKRATVIWDDKVPDMQDDTQTYAEGAIVFINPGVMDLRVLGGRDWKCGPWEKPVDQDAKQTTSLWAGQLVVLNRRKFGVIHGVLKTAITAA